MQTSANQLKLQIDRLATKVAGNKAGGDDGDGAGGGRGTLNYRRNVRDGANRPRVGNATPGPPPPEE